MLKLKLKDNHIYYLVVIIIFFLVCIISTLKYRDGEIDYHNSDATWHTLLTVTAYNETPIYEHLFLPIVSLGGIDDKDIKWGETIPDEKGNYYYTSFSPAGYFAPWLFLKITNLPVNEQGLYIFNTFLFGSSAILLIYLLSLIYHEEKHYPFISLIGGLCYISAPEILHNMGIVYWHQSLLQVMLILQTIMYYKYINEKSNFSKYLFYGLSIINPYIEWTGYIANIGFAIAEFIRYWNIDKRKGLKNVFCLAILTMLSFELFSIHYLTRVDSITFLTALKNRFLSRSAGAAIELATLFGSYFKSFLYVWVILIISLIFCFIKNKQLELKHGLIFLVLSFPILENIIMKGHAFAYSYDRMKAILLLVLLICEITRNIIASKK